MCISCPILEPAAAPRSPGSSYYGTKLVTKIWTPCVLTAIGSYCFSGVAHNRAREHVYEPLVCTGVHLHVKLTTSSPCVPDVSNSNTAAWVPRFSAAAHSHSDKADSCFVTVSSSFPAACMHSSLGTVRPDGGRGGVGDTHLLKESTVPAALSLTGDSHFPNCTDWRLVPSPSTPSLWP